MFITILDNSVKAVFMYDYMGEYTEDGNPTDQGINQVLSKYSHDVTQCTFMVHESSLIHKRLFHSHHNNDLIENIYE